MGLAGSALMRPPAERRWMFGTLWTTGGVPPVSPISPGPDGGLENSRLSVGSTPQVRQDPGFPPMFRWDHLRPNWGDSPCQGLKRIAPSTLILWLTSW